MRYAILNPERNAIVSAFEADSLPPHKPGRVLPVVMDGEPAYDMATHKIVPGDFVIGDGQVTQLWSVVAWNGFELYQRALDAGYTVPPEGFILRLADPDRAQFAQMLALVKEALNLGLITNETPQTIAGQGNTIHTVTTLRFREIMVAYGLHYKALWDELVASQP